MESPRKAISTIPDILIIPNMITSFKQNRDISAKRRNVPVDYKIWIEKRSFACCAEADFTPP